MAKVTDLSRAAGAAVAELVDALDSKSNNRKVVRVLVSPAAPIVRGALLLPPMLKLWRARKIVWSQGRVGSSPTSGTLYILTLPPHTVSCEEDSFCLLRKEDCMHVPPYGPALDDTL